MHEVMTEFWTCGKVAPDAFREAFRELGHWADDFPSDGLECMTERFGEMGIAAWARFMDLTIAINEGALEELIVVREDGAEEISWAVIEAGAVVPMEFDGLTMDRGELVREAMRRLAASENGAGLRIEDL